MAAVASQQEAGGAAAMQEEEAAAATTQEEKAAAATTQEEEAAAAMEDEKAWVDVIQFYGQENVSENMPNSIPVAALGVEQQMDTVRLCWWRNFFKKYYKYFFLCYLICDKHHFFITCERFST